MENLLQEFRGELAGFREMTEKFYAGEVSTKEYKGFSGGFGSYAQKGGRASMLRLRLPGGRVTKEKLRFIADAIEEYGIDKVHFTTCQTVQFHNLSAKAVCELMEKALDAGIVTRGGGGDFPRNVMASPPVPLEYRFQVRRSLMRMLSISLVVWYRLPRRRTV